jgi:serine/threonine protein phosphatase 1
MTRHIVIGDIHGCKKTLEALILELKLTTDDLLIFLGDYVDRGPDSAGVIRFLMQLSQTYNCVFLRGNHEQMMLDSLQDAQMMQSWLKYGGAETLMSFHVESVYEVPADIIEWLEHLPYYFVTHQAIYVHAGVNPTNINPLEDKEAMLWIRKFDADPEKTDGKWIVHGHTPIGMEQIIEGVNEIDTTFNLCLDNGCVYYKKREGMGHLCAFISNTKSLICQINLDF